MFAENSMSLKRMGNRVRALRRLFGLSQEDFAKRVGISRGFLSDIECAHRRVSIVTLARIARTCGISADRMLGLRGAR
jgi:transcriptional regulator with XRE-family HTH domain